MWTLFGGKGGVGKTTCAAAWGLARAARGARALVLSTDPAHSLSDAFGTRLRKGAATPIGRSLYALELDGPAAVRRWLTRRRPALALLIDRGTLLDRDDVEQILSLPIPGLDELAAFIAIAELGASGAYDELVIDTAPTGHTLRLLDLATVVGGFTELLQAMHDRHAMVAQALGGKTGASDLVEELRHAAAAVSTELRDPSRTQMMWVTLAEPMVVAETLRTVEWLLMRRFPVRSVVVNRVAAVSMTAAQARRCRECRARAAYERTAAAPLAQALRRVRPDLEIRTLPLCEQEPRGRRLLATLGQRLIGPARTMDRRRRVVARPPRLKPVRAGSDGSALRLASARLLFFGGKGGVGKTTCAAAAALAIARGFPARTIRLLSTDPAPSVGDVLSMKVGDAWTPVPGAGRVEARELDAAARFEAFRREYGDAVEDFFDRLRGGSRFDAVADRAVFARLFDLAPPGIDELVALVTVIDLLESEPDSLVIVDMAPTGHALRLLSAQDDLRRWLALLMRVLVKYQLAARAESFVRDLVDLSRRLRVFAALVADPHSSRFVAVVRPSELPRLETVRLLAALRTLRVTAPALIVNAETVGTCAACRRRARAEGRQLREVRRLCRARSGRCDIIHAPLQLPPPRGAAELVQWSASWIRDGDE